jgi:hypothetical protein
MVAGRMKGLTANCIVEFKKTSNLIRWRREPAWSFQHRDPNLARHAFEPCSKFGVFRPYNLTTDAWPLQNLLL